ncbi:MAG: hypothetical protein IPK58_18495 [Acidobacteria bacterium]|nr:hypothetical protein [Acidobacteriota bacterium]
MTEEKKQHDDQSTKEKLGAVGQLIVGELEKISGILTGDPTTQAEGDYNLEAGSLHLENADAGSDKAAEENS